MQNKKTIYINLPVVDLAVSEKFYTALGFTKNPVFSDENAISMIWSEEIVVMLLKHDFYKNFIGDKKIIDAKTTSGVLNSLSMNSKEEVQKFADIAKENGGEYFMSEFNKNLDFMFTYEVSDPDGNVWEPVFMDMSKFPQ
jgi:predicted lactoylglutathione lyase